jgi:hypothetical protein
MLASILDPPFVKKQYCHINSDWGSGQGNFERSLKNYFPLSDYTPAYRRQGFQKMIPQIFLYF